jgi:branched-chain amino acid transport system substrate-binding protein
MQEPIERRRLAALLCAAPLLARPRPASAAKQYDPGATDTEIKLGTTSPYSGPASSYGQYGRAQMAYFSMLNEQGGINGRTVNLISLDDAYSPPKTIEQTRRLIESDGVLAIAGPLGTAPNTAIQKYLNARKIPHLFLTSGGSRFNNPANFPWSIPLYPSYDTVGRVYAHHVLTTNPGAKIAVLHLNDDLGKDHLHGLRAGLGANADAIIVTVQTHEVSDPSVDEQIITLQSSGADTVFLFTTPKFAAQGIRRIADLGWRPQTFLSNTAASTRTTLIPAGLDHATGVITASWEKRADDPQWASDPDMVTFIATVKKYMPSADLAEDSIVPGYVNAAMIASVLAACGDQLTRADILDKATHLAGVEPPMLLPGIRLSNTPSDYTAFHQLRLMRFDGARWVGLGELIDLDRAKA